MANSQAANEEVILPKQDTCWFETLPNELITSIISFLDAQCPSQSNFNQQPSLSLTDSAMTPLKNFSRVSRRFRRLVLTRLFTHTRFDPYHLREFREFIKRNELGLKVRTVVASLQGPCNHLHPAWWARLLNCVPSCQVFTIICAPHVFAELGHSGIVSTDTWAFNMPYQTIQFRADAETLRNAKRISLNYLPNLFTARPWTEFRVNEGSSLKAYTTYEYFLRRTPSLMGTLHESKSVDAEAMFAELRSFSFTAIFPFYNHVEIILKSVRKMKKLKILAMKICPEPESTVLADEIEGAQGHIDVNDPWNEFDTAYALIAHSTMFLADSGELEELRVDDVKMEGIRENLEMSMTRRLERKWRYDGNGLWRRLKREEEASMAETTVPIHIVDVV